MKRVYFLSVPTSSHSASTLYEWLLSLSSSAVELVDWAFRPARDFLADGPASGVGAVGDATCFLFGAMVAVLCARAIDGGQRAAGGCRQGGLEGR